MAKGVGLAPVPERPRLPAVGTLAERLRFLFRRQACPGEVLGRGRECRRSPASAQFGFGLQELGEGHRLTSADTAVIAAPVLHFDTEAEIVGELFALGVVPGDQPQRGAGLGEAIICC